MNEKTTTTTTGVANTATVFAKGTLKVKFLGQHQTFGH
jgi:hypothetical protein